MTSTISSMTRIGFKQEEPTSLCVYGEQHHDIDIMTFRFRGKEFKGVSWIDVVRSLERDDKEYRSCGGPIRQYLTWSLNQLSGTVGPRDIDLSDRLNDETLALVYLLLLDEYGVGEVVGPIARIEGVIHE